MEALVDEGVVCLEQNLVEKNGRARIGKPTAHMNSFVLRFDLFPEFEQVAGDWQIGPLEADTLDSD